MFIRDTGDDFFGKSDVVANESNDATWLGWVQLKMFRETIYSMKK